MAIIEPYSRSAPTETSTVKQVANKSTLVYLKVIRIPEINWNILITLEFIE
jgi:hypothetical protein